MKSTEEDYVKQQKMRDQERKRLTGHTDTGRKTGLLVKGVDFRPILEEEEGKKARKKKRKKRDEP